MFDISLRPLAEVILDQVTAGRKEAYRSLREKTFQLKRKVDTIASGRLSPVRDPNLSNEITDSLRQTFNEMNSEIYNLYDQCATYKRNNPGGLELPSVDDVLAELDQCKREMVEIRWNLEEKWVSAVTDRIVLTVPDSDNHTIDLGPFEIRLFYEPTRTARRPSRGDGTRTYLYRIIALEPNYPLSQRRANGTGQNPHPHINGQVLCEGEATTALTRALNEFRLCDFFILINATLNHYNPQSPHYRLPEWDRVRCRDCSTYVVEDNLVPCSYCETKLCQSCAAIKTCAICSKTICSRHTGQRRVRKCDDCDQYVCLQHYKSVRKHSCFKEIKKKRLEAAKKRLELIEQVNTHRAKIAQEGIVPEPEEPQQNIITIENVISHVADMNRSEIAGQVYSGNRPDNRSPEDVMRDFEEGADNEAARQRANQLGVDEEEITGPAGWAN
jgi:hypothetical protein